MILRKYVVPVEKECWLSDEQNIVGRMLKYVILLDKVKVRRGRNKIRL